MADSRIHISLCDGPTTNKQLKPWAGTIDDLVFSFGKAEVGPKDGSYFVRGPFSKPLRENENITRADLLIIDGDKRIDPGTGELMDGAPAPHIAHEALQEMQWPHIVYTSHSHDPDRQYFRWRAIIPAPILTPEELLAMADHAVCGLQRAGCHVANVKENGTWSQAWYLPRKRSEDAHFAVYDGTDADPITRDQVERITEAWKAANAKHGPREMPNKGRSSPSDPTTSIGRYVATYGNPDGITAILERNGYEFKSFDRVNDEVAYRFIAPGSTSGTPGVRVYAGRDDGRWLVYSHHGDSDPLSKLGAVDAFDVFAELEHGGDKGKAVGVYEAGLRAEIEAGQRDYPRYRLLTFNEFSSDPPELEIVENVLPAAGTACIYGRSGTGKTFLTIDLMMAISRGLDDWFGYRVMQSPVVYLALEGAQGMRDRMEAYRMRRLCDIPDAFRILDDRFSLASAEDRSALIKAVRECGLDRPVVVIDTMTRATPGLDLNGPKDMGTVIASVDAIQRELGGLVISNTTLR